jgi:hypothetical protein
MHLLEWLAALIALAGAWCIGSPRQDVRQLGFCAFLLSNTLWITSARGIITNRSKER